MTRKEIIKEETYKSVNSIKYYHYFVEQVLSRVEDRLTEKYTKEELYICYYRALQVFILPDLESRVLFLITALEVGKVRATRILQKILVCEQDGVFGPLTRKALNVSNVEELKTAFYEERESLVYKTIKFLNL